MKLLFTDVDILDEFKQETNIDDITASLISASNITSISPYRKKNLQPVSGQLGGWRGKRGERVRCISECVCDYFRQLPI